MVMTMMRIIPYDDDDEVEPAPGVREVLLPSVGRHLDDHLSDEDDGEDLIHVLKNHLQQRSLRQVYVFDRLPPTHKRSLTNLFRSI